MPAADCVPAVASNSVMQINVPSSTWLHSQQRPAFEYPFPPQSCLCLIGVFICTNTHTHVYIQYDKCWRCASTILSLLIEPVSQSAFHANKKEQYTLISYFCLYSILLHTPCVRVRKITLIINILFFKINRCCTCFVHAPLIKTLSLFHYALQNILSVHYYPIVPGPYVEHK